MRTKRVAVVSLIAFCLGGVGGGAYAYITHPINHGDGETSLTLNLEQAHENWEVEQFINEQEKLRPDGMEESKITTGSKYTGITYHNGVANTVAPSSANQTVSEADPAVDEEQDNNRGGLLSSLFGKNKKEEAAQSGNDSQSDTVGRINIQKGSLNVRAQGSTDSTIIGQVYKDDKVQIVGRNGAWYQVITENGLEGYVSATYVEVTEEL